MLSSFRYHLLILFGHLSSLTYPRTFRNLTIRYINSSLATRNNLFRWGSSHSPECSFCLSSESLLHVVAGFQLYLERFTWRHDSILNFIATSLQPAINDRSSLCADVIGYSSLSVITADTFGLYGQIF